MQMPVAGSGQKAGKSKDGMHQDADLRACFTVHDLILSY